MRNKTLSRYAVVLTIVLMLTSIALAAPQMVCRSGRCRVMPVAAPTPMSADPLDPAAPFQERLPLVDVARIRPAAPRPPKVGSCRRIITTRGPLIACPVGHGWVIVGSGYSGHLFRR